MTVNWENLKHKMCPQCGYNGHFIVNVTWHGSVRLYEEGTEELSGGSTEWNDDSYVQCPECNWDGEMGQLEWMKHISSFMRSNLIVLLEYGQLTRKLLPGQALRQMDLSDEAFEEVLGFFDDLLMEIGE